MERIKYFTVGHRDHVYCNPLNEQKFDELLTLLDLGSNTRMLDIACGKGELLRRAAATYGARGTGIDKEDSWLSYGRERAAADGLASQLDFQCLDGASFEAADGSFDVAMCLGASWIWGGHHGALKALKRWARPGGTVVVGEPFWRRSPPLAYLQAEGLAASEFDTHYANVHAGLALDLDFHHAIVASGDDWDRYEGYQWRAIERYARAHPDDPDVPTLLAESHGHRDAYLQWGRDVLGWAVYIFGRPREDTA